MTDQKPKPDKPCHICGKDEWYFPGDYYLGLKEWRCGFCYPKPRKKERDEGV